VTDTNIDRTGAGTSRPPGAGIAELSGTGVPADWIRPRRKETSAGQRAGALADHQLVCGIGDYELDVLVREIGRPERLETGGQLTLADAIHEPASRVRLTHVEAAATRVIGATETDTFGEFGFRAALSSHYGLRIGDQADAPCVLVWEAGA
jgi:hypothetical protein